MVSVSRSRPPKDMPRARSLSVLIWFFGPLLRSAIWLELTVRSRAMVAMISDFISPDYAKAMGALAQRHDFRAVRVTDPAEARPLPDIGLLHTVDAETGEERWIDTSGDAGRSEQLSKIRQRERERM